MSLMSYVLEAPAKVIAEICNELIDKKINEENLLFAINGRFCDLKDTIDVNKYLD